jgi:hypothetical protein
MILFISLSMIDTDVCMFLLVDDLYIADQFLTRHGYITDHQLGPSCGNHSSSSSSSSSKTGPGDHRIAQYACLWGSRINELEFLPDLK